jgi:tetratricopeptide (TPR) repeat protein
MATAKAPNTTTGTAAGKPKGSRRRQLWQVPLFLTGVASLFAVWQYRPLAGDQSARQLDRDLSAVRQILANPEGGALEAEEAVHLAERAVEASERVEGRAGEACFLLGSAQVRLSDRSPPDEAWQYWGPALMNLQQAEKKGVPEPDQTLLLYRLGKAGIHANDDPRQVVARLAASADQVERPALPGDRVERPGEAYSLLTEAYLRLQPPDLEAALAANTKLRTKVAGVREDVLAPARLLSAELNLRLHRVEKARDDLKRINDLAPPAVQLRARVLLARSYQDESRWEEAAAAWQAILDDRGLAPPDVNGIRYHLGICHQHLKQPEEAARLWEECTRTPGGPEVAAAALALAELRLRGAVPESALVALTLAVRYVKGPGDWHNELAGVDKARGVFEAAVGTYRQAGKWDLALAAAEAYQKLAVAPRAAILRAEVAAEWARALRNQARQAQPSKALKVEDEGIRGLFVRAGAAYAEAADATRPVLEHADCLRLSGLCYLDGQDFDQARQRLEQARQLEESTWDTLAPDKKIERQARLGELWFLCGEALRQRKERELASASASDEARRQPRQWEATLAAYGKCIEYATSFAYQARLQQALLLVEMRQLDEAATNLQQNVQLMRRDPEPDAQALEKSLFALGGVLYWQRNYGEAISRFEDALQMARRRDDSSRSHPSPSPEAALASYHLADSYLQLFRKLDKDAADGSQSRENQEHWKQQAQGFLKKADETFRDLEQFLQTPEGKDHLALADRLDVSLSVADCQFYLGNFEDALALYEKQIDQLKTELETYEKLGPAQRDQSEYFLQALSRTIRCYSAKERWDYVQIRAADTRRVLEKVKPALPPEKVEEWEKWLDVAAGPKNSSKK